MNMVGSGAKKLPFCDIIRKLSIIVIPTLIKRSIGMIIIVQRGRVEK